MTLEDAIAAELDLVVVCHPPACGAMTALSARFFAGRCGLDTPVERLAEHLRCAGCGGGDVSLLATRSEPPEALKPYRGRTRAAN